MISVLAVAGVVLGAWYMLWMVQRVFFGPLREPHTGEAHAVHDLSRREVAALAPLAVLVVWIGIQPAFFLERMAPTLDGVTAVAQESLNVEYGDTAQTFGTREFRGHTDRPAGGEHACSLIFPRSAWCGRNSC